MGCYIKAMAVPVRTGGQCNLQLRVASIPPTTHLAAVSLRGLLDLLRKLHSGQSLMNISTIGQVIPAWKT